MSKTIILPTDHFTGDTHFWHRTILKPDYGDRRFNDVEEMNTHPEYAPWSFAELCERMKERGFIQVDHHHEGLRDKR